MEKLSGRGEAGVAAAGEASELMGRRYRSSGLKSFRLRLCSCWLRC